MCRLNQLEEFYYSKEREIERLKVRCVLFHNLNELSIYRAHNRQAYEFASLLIVPLFVTNLWMKDTGSSTEVCKGSYIPH